MDHVATISPEYARIVERCLRRDLTARYPSAAALQRDLRHLQAGEVLEPTGGVAIVAAADAAIEQLSNDARASAGGTVVGAAAPTPTRPRVLRPVRVEETLTPVVRTPPPARRTAVVVGTTAALVAALGVGVVSLNNHRPASADLPRAAAVHPASPIEPAHAVIAAPAASSTPEARIDSPDADVPTVIAPTGAVVVAAPLEDPPAEPAGHHAHGRRRLPVAPPPVAATATVALPVLAAPPPLPVPPPPPPPARTGVGTADYE